MDDGERAIWVLLGAALRAAGFEQERVSDALAAPTGSVPRLDHDRVAFQRRRLVPGRALHALVDLFVLGGDVASGEFDPLLGDLSVDDLEAVGVVERAGAAVRARCAITPVGGHLVAGDLARSRQREFDSVPTQTPSSEAMLAVVPRGPVGSVLDVGAGSGVLGLAAGAQATSVVATDINERALEYVERSAALNGMDHVEVRLGSLFEPVEGERFDRIVCNPPYIIAPAVANMYEHAGLPGDSVSATVVRQAAEHLADGGTATIICNWAHASGDWASPPLRWVDRPDCDVIVALISSTDALGYVEGLQAPGVEAAADAEAWLGYLADQGIEHVAGGFVFLRRRPGAGRRVRQEVVLDSRPAPRFHETVQRLFAGIERLDAVEPESLLELVVRRIPGWRVEQAQVDVAGQVQGSASISWPPGAGLSVDADVVDLAIWELLDGATTLAQAARDLADATGLDEAPVAARCVTLARRLVLAGVAEFA